MSNVVKAEAKIEMKSGTSTKPPQRVEHENGIILHFKDNVLSSIEDNGYCVEVGRINDALSKCGLVIVSGHDILERILNTKTTLDQANESKVN